MVAFTFTIDFFHWPCHTQNHKTVDKSAQMCYNVRDFKKGENKMKFKLNKKGLYNTCAILLAGGIALGGMHYYFQKNKEQEVPSFEPKQEQVQSPIEVDSELNDKIVYCIMKKERTLLNNETKEYSEWGEWNIVSGYFLGTTSEEYDKEITQDDQTIYKKVKVGTIDNEFTMDDFIGIKGIYQEEKLVNGEWERTGFSTNNIDIVMETKQDETIRWGLDDIRSVKNQPEKYSVTNQTVSYVYQLESLEDESSEEKEYYITMDPSNLPEVSENQKFTFVDTQTQTNKAYHLQREYVLIQNEDGLLEYVPTTRFTTVGNMVVDPNLDSVWKDAGIYYLSEELANELQTAKAEPEKIMIK